MSHGTARGESVNSLMSMKTMLVICLAFAVARCQQIEHVLDGGSATPSSKHQMTEYVSEKSRGFESRAVNEAAAVSWHVNDTLSI